MKKFNKSRLAIALFGATLSTNAFSFEFIINQISDQPTVSEAGININEHGQVAWLQHNWDSTPHDIKFWDGESVSKIAETTNYIYMPNMRPLSLGDDGKIVWLDISSPESIMSDQVKVWKNGETSLVTSDLKSRDGLSSVNSLGQFAWGEGIGYHLNSVVVSDGVTSSVIADNLTGAVWYHGVDLNDVGQVVYGEFVYMDNGSFSDTLLLWDGNTQIELHTESGYDRWFNYAPQLNNQGQVLWSIGYAGGGAVYLWDGSQVKTLVDSTDHWGTFCIDMNNSGEAVWVSYKKDSPFVIQYWDGTSVQTVAEGTCPSINDAGQIVYSKYEGQAGYSVYVTDGAETFQLASGLPPVHTDIGEGGDVVWGSIDGAYVANVPRPLTPLDSVHELRDWVAELNGAEGVVNSLIVKLDTAIALLSDRSIMNDKAAVGTLNAFIAEMAIQEVNQSEWYDAPIMRTEAMGIVERLEAELN